MSMINILQKILSRREIWKIGVFQISCADSAMGLNSSEPIKILKEKGIRLTKKYKSTIADPFLFAHQNTLYLFYESKTDHYHGTINLISMSENGEWIEHGEILREKFHLSYPQVFENDGDIYMIPEAAQSGKVLLYRSKNFPFEWQNISQLVNEPLRDPTLLRLNEKFFLLSTTSDYKLKLYVADNIEEKFQDTGIIITEDKRFARCAGGILKIDGKLLRPAQDCFDIYGNYVNFREMVMVTPLRYIEVESNYEIKNMGLKWNLKGSHHISVVEYKGKTYVALDGREPDLLINTFTLAMMRLQECINLKINQWRGFNLTKR